MYNPKDCNSILKYIERRSEEDINNEEPKALNKTIKQYSVLGVYKPIKLNEVFLEADWTPCRG
jgi:hypothetical protein